MKSDTSEKGLESLIVEAMTVFVVARRDLKVSTRQAKAGEVPVGYWGRLKITTANTPWISFSFGFSYCHPKLR
jgi:hypothetical protein